MKKWIGWFLWWACQKFQAKLPRLAGYLPAGFLPLAPGPERSREWPKVREAFLKKNPACAICGRQNKLEVHHIIPFHLNAQLELAEDNLIALCDPGQGGCHLLFGHLGHWASWNALIREDADLWANRFKNRPKISPASS